MVQLNLMGNSIYNEEVEKEIKRYKDAIEEYKNVLKQNDEWREEWFAYHFHEIGRSIESIDNEIRYQINFCEEELKDLKKNIINKRF